MTEISSPSEMIDVLRSCIKKEVFEQVKTLLISQKTSEQEKYELLQQERNELLQGNLSLSKELKECRELVGQLRETGEMVSRNHIQVCRQLQSVSAELAIMKAEKVNTRDVIIQDILSQLTVLEEGLDTDQAITPSFDLNMPPQDDS